MRILICLEPPCSFEGSRSYGSPARETSPNVFSAITSVIDAKTGRVRDLHNGPIATLILRPSGSVAWLTGSPPDAELNLWTATRRTHDSGDISDVHVEGVRLVWTKAGTRLSTSFD